MEVFNSSLTIILMIGLVIQQSAGFWLFNVIFPPTAKPHTATNNTPPVIIGKASCFSLISEQREDYHSELFLSVVKYFMECICK